MSAWSALTPGLQTSLVESLQQDAAAAIRAKSEAMRCQTGVTVVFAHQYREKERRGRVGRSVIMYSTLCTEKSFDLIWIAFFPPTGTFLCYVPRGLTSFSESLSTSSLSEAELCFKSKTTQNIFLAMKTDLCLCFGASIQADLLYQIFRFPAINWLSP